MKRDREVVYSALFELVKQVTDAVTISRRIRHWSEVSPSEQPAVFQVQRKELAESSGRGIDTKWTLLLDIVVYAYSDDISVSPSIQLNKLLDEIDRAFPTGPALPQTLGGLVHEARISGEITTDEGALGPQAVAIVPIRIVTT